MMPNFSDSLQTNSILTRRIMKLKIEKGFTINKEEAEDKARQEAGTSETNVSAALSLNQPSLLGVNLDQINIGSNVSPQPKKTKKQEQKPQIDLISDLLDMNESPKP
jgi:hypothetical protein